MGYFNKVLSSFMADCGKNSLKLTVDIVFAEIFSLSSLFDYTTETIFQTGEFTTDIWM